MKDLSEAHTAGTPPSISIFISLSPYWHSFSTNSKCKYGIPQFVKKWRTGTGKKSVFSPSAKSRF